MGMSERLYTILETAKLLGVSRQTVYNLVKNRVIRTANLNMSRVFITADAINEYLASKK